MMEPKGAILECWLTMLSEYEFNIKHRAGMKHSNANALSRGGKPDPADPDTDDSASTIQAIAIIPTPDLRECMRITQEDDKTLATIRDWVI